MLIDRVLVAALSKNLIPWDRSMTQADVEELFSESEPKVIGGCEYKLSNIVQGVKGKVDYVFGTNGFSQIKDPVLVVVEATLEATSI